MSTRYDNVEVYKTIRENLVIEPGMTNTELAEQATMVMHRPVSIDKIASIRKQVTPTLAGRHTITLRVLRLDDLHPEHGSFAIYPEDLDNEDPLVVSIRKHGILEPLTVSQDGRSSYRIIDGVRRYWVLAKLDIREVPCIVYGEMSRNRRLAMRDIVTTQYEYRKRSRS